VPTAQRAIDLGTRIADRQRREIGEEFRERRLQLDKSQDEVAKACRISRVHYGHVENGRVPKLTLLEVNHIAAVLGLIPHVRIYPTGAAIRDIGQTTRLQRFLAPTAPPLTYRLEVPLPAIGDRLERRAWDAVLSGRGWRTAIELEMRLRDIQAQIRRVDLKRRDDPTEFFLLLIADTRTNRRVLAEFSGLFADLRRLRPSDVRRALEAGRHPGSGIVLV